MTASAAVRTSPLRTWLLWTTGFLAFPLAGLAGTAVAGRVDSPSLRCSAARSPGW